MKPTVAGLFLLILCASSFFLNAQTSDAPDTSLRCIDSARFCLDHTLNTYLKALLVRKPEALRVTDNLTFSENGINLKLGKGLWETITGFNVSAAGGMKQEYLDVSRGVAGVYMVSLEGRSPALFALRIHVEDQKINSVETMVVRNQQEGGIFDIASFHGPSSEMSAVPAKELLPTREDAIRISERYLDGLRTGSFAGSEMAIAPDAYRVENGRLTAGSGCTATPGCENLRARKATPFPELRHRIDVVDETLGLVWIREDFGSRVAWEGLKIYGGQIHAIEGIGRVYPASGN
jgi:hypothetical protein